MYLPQGLKLKYCFEINLFNSTAVDSSTPSVIVVIGSLKKQVGVLAF